MLTQEQNEQITRTGAGTLMGDYFRRYWIPALHAGELPEPDGAPVRVQLLGEKLIAFRDTTGRIGLLEEFCAHRGVSLWFGRNEASGLRCPYTAGNTTSTAIASTCPPNRNRLACASASS